MKGEKFENAREALEWARDNRGRVICFKSLGTLDGIRCTKEGRLEYCAILECETEGWFLAGPILVTLCDGRDIWEWTDEPEESEPEESEEMKTLKRLEREIKEVRERLEAKEGEK